MRRLAAAPRLVTGTDDAWLPPIASSGGPTDTEALDAYSTVVTRVAERLRSSVANLSVARRRGQGSGSGVVITPDGFLVTSAHVVDGARGGTATFTDGRDATFTVIGQDALSDLAVVRVASDGLVAARSATRTGSGSGSWSSRSATRSASPAASRPVS